MGIIACGVYINILHRLMVVYLCVAIILRVCSDGNFYYFYLKFLPFLFIIGTYGAPADCWSMGAVLYVMLVARFPEFHKHENGRIELKLPGPLWDNKSAEARALVKVRCFVLFGFMDIIVRMKTSVHIRVDVNQCLLLSYCCYHCSVRVLICRYIYINRLSHFCLSFHVFTLVLLGLDVLRPQQAPHSPSGTVPPLAGSLRHLTLQF